MAKRAENIICECRVICHFSIRTGVQSGSREKEKDDTEIAKWSQFLTVNFPLLPLPSVSSFLAHSLSPLYLLYILHSPPVFLTHSLSHTHNVGSPQKGELNTYVKLRIRTVCSVI